MASRPARFCRSSEFDRNSSFAVRTFSRVSPVIHNVLDPGYELALVASRDVDAEFARGAIVSLGSVHGYRNLVTLLEAYQLYRISGGRRRLVVAGAQSNRSLAQRLESRARNSEGVRWMGRALTRAETQAVMRVAHAVVLPSRVEASPLSILEAAAANDRVLASRIVGHQEVIKSYGGLDASGLFDPKSPEDIARRLLEDGPTCLASSAKLRDPAHRAESRDNWALRIAEWISTLEPNTAQHGL